MRHRLEGARAHAARLSRAAAAPARIVRTGATGTGTHAERDLLDAVGRWRDRKSVV